MSFFCVGEGQIKSAMPQCADLMSGLDALYVSAPSPVPSPLYLHIRVVCSMQYAPCAPCMPT